MSTASERRRYTRYRMKDNAFATLNCPNTIVGKIRDLSMGGISFEFIATSSEEVREPELQTMDIFLLGGGTRGISNVPCTIFFRAPSAHFEDPGRVFFPAVISRVCVAEFRKLTQEQERALIDFLMQYSTGYSA